MGDTGAPSHLWICASDCLIRVTDTLQITISEQLTNKLTQPNHQKSLQMIALVSYFDKRFKLSDHQHQCVAYLGMRGMSRWFFLGSRNPRKVERDQQCGRTGSSETMASQPHYPLPACSVTLQLQSVFLQKN